MRLVNANVFFLLHPLDKLFNHLLQLLATHVLDLLLRLLVEHVAIQQRFRNRLSQIVQRLLSVVQIVIILILLLKATLQQIIRECVEQVFHAHLRSRLGNVFLVFDELHKTGSALFAISGLNTSTLDSVATLKSFQALKSVRIASTPNAA